jgi:hypothetical protein
MSRKVRKRKKQGSESPLTKPNWAIRQSILVFLFMLAFMFIWRIIQKGNEFGAPDVIFIVLFAIVMAVIELFRRRRAEL